MRSRSARSGFPLPTSRYLYTWTESAEIISKRSPASSSDAPVFPTAVGPTRTRCRDCSCPPAVMDSSPSAGFRISRRSILLFFRFLGWYMNLTSSFSISFRILGTTFHLVFIVGKFPYVPDLFHGLHGCPGKDIFIRIVSQQFIKRYYHVTSSSMSVIISDTLSFLHNSAVTIDRI